MAASQPKPGAAGSAEWIQGERDAAEYLVGADVDAFSDYVRNELEWLNEHMADVFSKSHVSFADVFKTPSKLRGKTPRTARKRDGLTQRAPLTDIFAPNIPIPQAAPTSKSPFLDKIAHFKIAEDASDRTSGTQRPANRSKSPRRIGKPINTDSGYHGMTEDEMDIDARTESMTEASQHSDFQSVPLRDDQARPQPNRTDTAEGGGVSDDSFVSAKEGPAGHTAPEEQQLPEMTGALPISAPDAMEVDVEMNNVEQPALVEHDHNNEPEQTTQNTDAGPSRSQSETSSPEKLLQRKSSFAFTALPAREPLTGKKSIGAFERSTGGRSLDMDQADEAEYAPEKPAETKVHNKTSTQSLHERIKMLGKTKEPRPSKSVHQNTLNPVQYTYNQLPADDAVVVSQNHVGKTITPVDDSDDDWIAPPKKAVQQSPARPAMHQKSISTTAVPSPQRKDLMPELAVQKAQSISNFHLSHNASGAQSTTPAGSPASKRQFDGTVSASKNKLFSVLSSARKLFASSTNTSAAAKVEAHSTSPSRSPTREVSAESKTAAVFNMPGAMYSERQLPASPTRPTSVVSAASRSPTKKATRSSTESERRKEKDLKAQQKAADELDKVREKERQRVAREQEQKAKVEQAETARKEKEQRQQHGAQQERQPMVEGQSVDGDNPPPPPSKTMVPSGKLRAAPGRMAKPSREPGQPSKPAPVSIRVASQSQRLGQASTLNKSQHESSAPPPPPKSALRPMSAQGSVRSSTAPNNSRVKALEAAARKKEADERAAQKKAEQKRELERKRAAKAEDDRRAEEERKAAEIQRLQEAKLAAQRQAEKHNAEMKRREQQRLEQQRQVEQQRREEEAERAREAHELAEAIKRERAIQQAAAHHRADVAGTLRQLGKNTIAEGPMARPATQSSAPKPVKRPLQLDDEVPSQPHYSQAAPPPQRPGLVRGPPSYQQTDAKRRRTNEEEADERPLVMAPPKRPSNMRKESTLAKFPYGYTHAPPPAPHHASMFKTAVTGQHQMQHGLKPLPGAHPSQMVQLSNARIPFADNANPPAPSASAYLQPVASQHHGGENLHPGQNKYKTPIRPVQAPKSAKSSPLYPNGDSIALPEIATDSEDEDSEDDDNTGFRAPSWVASPALRDLLTQQQLVDPESVFGPIAELKMDEVFRNGKNQDRLKRFRDRGSSAAWIETGDAVTSAEKRRDMELRERVARDGGWRYDPSV